MRPWAEPSPPRPQTRVLSRKPGEKSLLLTEKMSPQVTDEEITYSRICGDSHVATASLLGMTVGVRERKMRTANGRPYILINSVFAPRTRGVRAKWSPVIFYSVTS